MPTYTERYEQGDYEAVWAELVALGAAVRTEPLFSDAKAVAKLMMSRARQNVALLVERLHQLSFEFTTEPVWTRPDPQLLARLDTIEQQYGPLPIVFRSWFEVVGQVGFMGAHPRLSCYVGQKPPEAQGPVSDPLVVDGYGILEDDEHEAQPPYIFEFAPDLNHKANYSGGGDSWVELPSPGFDAPWDRPVAGMACPSSPTCGSVFSGAVFQDWTPILRQRLRRVRSWLCSPKICCQSKYEHLLEW